MTVGEAVSWSLWSQRCDHPAELGNWVVCPGSQLSLVEEAAALAPRRPARIRAASSSARLLSHSFVSGEFRCGEGFNPPVRVGGVVGCNQIVPATQYPLPAPQLHWRGFKLAAWASVLTASVFKQG